MNSLSDGAANELTVVLMSRNRPEFARQAIRSILRQDWPGFRFVVSDNSTDRELQDIVRAEFPSVEYVSRWPGISISEHFDAVMALVESPYFVMFHDDDLMEPGYVGAVLAEFRAHPETAAVATNTIRIDGRGERLQPPQSFTGASPRLVFSRPGEFLLRYLSVDGGGAAPFGAYAYNARVIRGLSLDFVRARNFCDTVFLADIVRRGPVVWINQPLVRVRVHEENFSNFCGTLDYKTFVTLVRRDYAGTVAARHVDEYRCLRLFMALEGRRRLPWPACKFFLRIFPRLFILSPPFRERVVRKLWRMLRRERAARTNPYESRNPLRR